MIGIGNYVSDGLGAASVLRSAVGKNVASPRGPVTLFGKGGIGPGPGSTMTVSKMTPGPSQVFARGPLTVSKYTPPPPQVFARGPLTVSKYDPLQQVILSSPQVGKGGGFSASSGSGSIPGYTPGGGGAVVSKGGSTYSASAAGGLIPGYTPPAYSASIPGGGAIPGYTPSDGGTVYPGYKALVYPGYKALVYPGEKAYGGKGGPPRWPGQRPTSAWLGPAPDYVDPSAGGGGGGGGYLPGGDELPPEELPEVPAEEGGLLSKIPWWGWAAAAAGVYFLFFRKKKAV